MRGAPSVVSGRLWAIAVATSLVASPAAALEPRFHDVKVVMRGSEVQIQGRLEDPDGTVAVVELFVHAFDQPYRKASAGLKDHAFVITWPIADLLGGEPSGRVGYYLVGTDAGGATVATLGSPQEPISVIITQVVEPGDLSVLTAPSATSAATQPTAAGPGLGEPPWYTRAWFWAMVGGVVVGGALVALVVVNR